MAVMDFEMFEGDTFTLRATVRDEAGSIVDITGVDISWWLAKTNKSTGADVYAQKTVGSGVEIVDGPAGRFDVTIESPDTEGRGGKTLYHEAEIDDGGVVSTVLVGKAKIKPALIP